MGNGAPWDKVVGGKEVKQVGDVDVLLVGLAPRRFARALGFAHVLGGGAPARASACRGMEEETLDAQGIPYVHAEPPVLVDTKTDHEKNRYLFALFGAAIPTA